VTTTSPASFASERERIARNLAEVHDAVRNAGRDPASVRIVCVTKTFSIGVANAAVAAGLTHLGENYFDELRDKVPVSPDGACWHYLGALQSNKIARIAALSNVISGVSRTKELERLSDVSFGGSIDVQVDTTELAQRNGASPRDVRDLVARARALGLHVRGLMTVAPPNPEGARQAFATVATLADDLGLIERSMGMSEDYQLACAYGATELRLGRLLLGPRTPTANVP